MNNESNKPEWWDTRAHVADFREIIVDGWKPSAAAYRKQNPPLALTYGTSVRQTLDLFGEDLGENPHLFIHGGFWHVPLDKNDFSHLAAGTHTLGIPTAIMSYDLCPTVGIEDILDQTSQAVRFLFERFGKQVVVSGHSAGGHAVAHLLKQPEVKAGYAISMVADLRSLVYAPMNASLQLDANRAEALSPLFWKGPRGKSFNAVVGADESDGFKDQTAAMAQAWEAQGVVVRASQIPNAHHLNVIAGLADPNSPMSLRIAELARSN